MNKCDPKELVRYYKTLSKEEILKIKTTWALGENLFSDFEGYVFALANTKELVGKMEFGAMGGDINPYELFSHRVEGNSRIAKILHRWSNQKLIDPPIIYSQFGRILPENGRHRLICAFHLGAEQIPVAIHESNKENISQHLDLTFLDN